MLSDIVLGVGGCRVEGLREWEKDRLGDGFAFRDLQVGGSRAARRARCLVQVLRFTDWGLEFRVYSFGIMV